ncbi:NAD(P)/FAD-dependent oxidoreductase [Microbacterium sp. PMB16]|uniref:NAD(P)/FAD-dependent oxidoreductase n=1 Tax=Microbacterium sp. PMB16 TaxID=3120157 RepID=UPI003F4C9940
MTALHPIEANGTIVIGAGVIGASIAYHLAARGESVTLMDAALPASGATRHSFAWISRFGRPNGPAAALRDLAKDDWDRLIAEVPGLDPVWSGALTWGEEFRRDLADRADDPIALEPGLRLRPSGARFSADDGWIDPVRAAEQLIEAARHRGTQTRFGQPVLRLVRDDDRGVVGVDIGQAVLEASKVVVAAGTGSAGLCASVGVDLPMMSAPAVLVRLRAAPGIIRRIVANDDFEARQGQDGTILMPMEYSGEDSVESLAQTGEAARKILLDSFDGADDARVVGVDVGWRPMMRDREPAVGETSAPGVHVAVAHPGVVLAATLGRLVADEITTSVEAPELARFRPRRFG